MLFVHEVHQVIGSRAADFESTYRREWVPAVAEPGDARVLWYANHAHLTCFAYHVLTITALRDGAAWMRLARRIHDGDLLESTRSLDQLRHDVEARMLLPAEGSPLGEVELTGLADEGTRDAGVLFVEDTVRAPVPVDERPHDELAETVARFAVAHPEDGGGELVQWRRVVRPDLLLASLTGHERDPFGDGRVEHRDSKLWRVSPWSPLG